MYFVLFCCCWCSVFSRYFDIMDACLQSQPVWLNMQELYDLQYFYVDPVNIGHCTSGIAFETMMSIYWEHRPIQFCGQEWYSAVRQSSENPLVQGFLAKHICLSHIVSNGLGIVSPSLGQMSHAPFTIKPNWDHQLSSGHPVCLYVPTAYNFKAVDAIILHVDYNTKKVNMYLIQITLSIWHKPSDKDFYGEMWERWVESLENAGFTVESTFVWIDKKQPAGHTGPQLVKKLWSGTKTIHPEYCSVHVGIGQVDPRLAIVLNL